MESSNDSFTWTVCRDDETLNSTPSPVRDIMSDEINSTEQLHTEHIEHKKKKRKKEKRSHEDVDDNIVDDIHSKSMKLEPNSDIEIPKNIMSDEINSSEQLITDHKKKKRKKEKRLREDVDDSIVDGVNSKSMKLEPNSDNERPKKKRRLNHTENSKSESFSETHVSDDDDFLNMKVKQEKISLLSPKKEKEHLKKDKNNISLSPNDHQSDNDTNIIIKEKKSKKDKRNVTFDNNIDSDMDVSRNLDFSENHDTTINQNDKEVSQNGFQSKNIEKFLELHSKLQKVSGSFDNALQITQNDDIWILTCPHEVDLRHLNTKELLMESKTKLKVNNETYYGTLLEEKNKITIMSFGDEMVSIENFNVSGTINFRKRLPKPKYQEDNVIVNNQTDFIPLPDTKCRHPLFGSNYKNAIKIPAHVAERLNTSDVNNTSISEHCEKKKRKKHKKEYKKEDESERSFKHPKEEQVEEVKVKKSKKRKHDEDMEGNNPKRIKQEHADSSQVWASEKAIEENLFTF